MTTGHLVTDTNLTFLGNVYLGHLNDTCGQLVTDSDGELLAFQLGIEFLVLLDEVHHQCTNQSVGMFILRPVAQLNSGEVQIAEVGSRESGAFGNNVGTHVILHTFRCIIFCKLQQLVYQHFLEITNLSVKFIVNLRKQSLVGQLGAAGLDNTGEQTLTDNNTLQRRRGFQRSVLHITGLVTEDGTEQFLFRRRIRFTLRSNLTDKDITRFDAGTHTNNTVFVKVFSRFLTYVRNVRGQLFHTTLRFANFQRIFFYVYRGQKVLTNHTFIQYDSILIVIALPRHVSNQQVLTQCKFSVFG